MKRIIFFVFFTLINVNAFSQNYETTHVVVEPFSDSIHRTGKLAFKNTALLTFKANGYLNVLSVDEGDKFSQGDLLASLEDNELLAEKNAQFAKLLQAKRELKRAQELLRRKLGSQQELDLVTTEVETARSAYQVSTYNLDKAKIIAPFSGVVLSRHTELGELQTPGKEVLRIASLSQNWVAKVALTSTEIGQVSLGQKVDVLIAGKGKFHGKIVKIPAIANTDANLFLIDILLPALDHENGVVAGQLVDVHIPQLSNDFVYRLPIDALVGVNEQGQAIVLIASEHQHSGTHVFSHNTFDIFKLDNDFAYLISSANATDLHVVIRGWQHLDIKK